MKRPAKRLLCLLLCLACSMGVFSSCAPAKYKIYHREIYCSDSTEWLWYTPFSSHSFPMGCGGDWFTETSFQDVAQHFQFQWNGEILSGEYRYTDRPYKKGMFDLKEDILYDYYSGSDSVGYEFAVERKSATLRSCSSFGKDPMRDIDIGSDSRRELLEQAVSRLEEHIPNHMKSAFVYEIDPDGYTLSYGTDPDLKFRLFSLQVTLYPNGSLRSFSGDQLDSIPSLASTNLELLQDQYEQLSSHEQIKAAVEERLHWLYQTPREDSHFVNVTTYAYPGLDTAKEEERYLLFEKSEWEFDPSAKESIYVYERTYLTPTGKLCVEAIARIFTHLTSKQGDIISDYRTPRFSITLF